MKTLLARLLVKEEDFVPHGYLDHLGYLTIGIGRLIDKRKGGGISEDEAIYLLANDINRIAAKLDVALPWWRGLDEVRQVVLASMAYQMGVGGLVSFTRTLKAVEERRYVDAGASMRKSLWYRQTPQRAERAARAMESGLASDLEL